MCQPISGLDRRQEANQQRQEADRQMQEAEQRRQEADKQRQEANQRMIQEANQQRQEADRRIQEANQRMIQEANQQRRETERLIKENARQIGKLSNRFGELAEHLVAPNIREKFNALGFSFEEVSQNKEITDAADNHVAEVDILLENGDTVIAVEVKAKPGEKDVEEHINRLEILRRRADARNDKRTFQGAIAGAIMSKELRNHIIKNGFYAIEQTGDTVKINIPEGFKARRW